MQVSPLNLKQVEIIKGSASILYGGGAIAGLVNLISKTPGKKPELSFLINQNSAEETDASAFTAGNGAKSGLRYLAAIITTELMIPVIPAFQRSLRAIACWSIQRSLGKL